jgi:tetratricopeptide (TPR) repeat protein
VSGVLERTRGLAIAATVAFAVATAVEPVGARQAPDPAAAERQYRIARRLAAEGSSDAAAALARVVELDPAGRLADDALVEQARLEGIAEWPDQLGRVDPGASHRAAALLDRVLGSFASSDRATEARLLRALLSIEPLAGRDRSAARVELLRVASADPRGPTGAAARYALGWLDESAADPARARAAYQRVVVEAPESEAAARARAGLGRLDMRAGRFGEAAAWLQLAVEAGAPEGSRAEDLRELAVRSQMRGLAHGGGWGRAGLRASTSARNVAGLVRLNDGGVLLGDSRAATLTRFDASGRAAATWGVANLQALALDPLGRAFVAAGEELYRVTDAGPVLLAGQGELAPVSALAVDAQGALWMADRKGTRIGRLDVGASTPVEIWRASSLRATLLAVDGRRLVAVDGKSGTLFTIDAGGRERVLDADSGLQKPTGLTVDPAGGIAVLDARAASVLLFDREGRLVERYLCGASGIARPVAIALGADGALDIIDAASGQWSRLP